VTNDTFKGKVYVANFFFTICPNVCPKLTTNMKLVAREFSDNNNVKFISHSVAPGIDSVPRLKKYAENYDIDSRQWHLVTGDNDEIYNLALNSYFAESGTTNVGFCTPNILCWWMLMDTFVASTKASFRRNDAPQEDINTLLAN
jgi:cytochrome oxidase Cu insertion factor (SCO1/SenC/PrrC family)